MALSNAAFVLLCHILESVRSTLPRTLIFYAAGQSDLGNERWDTHYESWKKVGRNLGDDLASQQPGEQYATLIFWLDELLADHQLHQCWAHLLDGECLWEQLTRGGDNLMFNVLWGLCLTVAAWLRTVSRVRGVSFLAAPAAPIAGAGGVSFLTAVGKATPGPPAGGVSFLTGASGATSSRSAAAVPKRAPWADEADAPVAPVEQRAKKVAKKVAFNVEPEPDQPREPQKSPDALVYFIILGCDQMQRVLLRAFES
eukprot:s9_g6.t1